MMGEEEEGEEYVTESDEEEEEEEEEYMTESDEEEEEEEEEYMTESDEEEEEEGEEYMTESDEEEEEVEQLEEMRAPVLTSWMGPDGITVPGIMCIDDGIFRLKNRCQLDDCSICYQPSTTHGKHQICCLPCGHMFGLSCIKKWLLSSSSSGKCPQCKTLCSFEDALLLYPPRLCLTSHQKATSAPLFPFTEQGLLEFKKYEYSRMLAAQLLRGDDITRMNILVRKYNEVAERWKELTRQLDSTRAEDLDDALQRRFKPQIDALERRSDALRRLVGALRRRMDALEQRSDAFESRIDFYLRMYEEHRKREEEIAKAKLDLERKKMQALLMCYYAAGAAAVLTVSLAVVYAFYA